MFFTKKHLIVWNSNKSNIFCMEIEVGFIEEGDGRLPACVEASSGRELPNSAVLRRTNLHFA